MTYSPAGFHWGKKSMLLMSPMVVTRKERLGVSLKGSSLNELLDGSWDLGKESLNETSRGQWLLCRLWNVSYPEATGDCKELKHISIEYPLNLVFSLYSQHAQRKRMPGSISTDKGRHFLASSFPQSSTWFWRGQAQPEGVEEKGKCNYEHHTWCSWGKKKHEP